MKNLKSQYHNDKWNGYEVVQLPIKDLFQSVPAAAKVRGKEFYKPLKEDIAKNGLRFPIMVVHSTRGELIKQKERYKDKMCELPFWLTDDKFIKLYTVWGGSNRLSIARELGYDTIDCVVIEDFNKARNMQALHRKPYQGKYY
jgi:hypothetical protein